MGVRGLNKFVDENPELSLPFKLYDTRVIIDGYNLVHFLYEWCEVDFIFGGNYSEFSKAIKQYFSFYFECNITPIVIFDGGHDQSNRMLEKLVERQENRMKNIHKLLQKGQSEYPILPINAHEVFKRTLSELGIIFAQCDFEGDNQMGALAKHYECPIISDDSDFYIYNLPRGFIRLSSIDSQVLKEKKKNGTLRKYLMCKIFYIDTFLKHYPLRDRSILPLLAILAGNDYAKYDDFKKFFYKIKVYPKDKFHGLLAWLSRYKLDQAIAQVLRLTDEEKLNDIETLIENAIEDYTLKPTNLINLLRAENMNLNKDFVRTSSIIAPCGNFLPEQFVIAYHKGYIPSSLLDVITLHQQFLMPQIEDFSNSSSYTCSLYIRQIMYGILLQHDGGNSKRHSKNCLKRISEYDRTNNTVQHSRVDYLTELDNGVFVPPLTEIYSMKKKDLRHFISIVLGIDMKILSGIPFDLQLIFACINYWLLNSSLSATKELVSALLLCIIYNQLQDVVSRDIKVDPKNTSTAKTSKNKNPVIQNISLSTAKLIIENLKKYVEQPVLSQADPLDMGILHSYSQLQTCILYAVTLNLLAGMPFNSPKLHKAIDGTMLYNLTKALHSRRNPDLFVKIMLGNNSDVFNLYNLFHNKFDHIIPEHLVKDKSQKKRKHRKKYAH